MTTRTAQTPVATTTDVPKRRGRKPNSANGNSVQPAVTTMRIGDITLVPAIQQLREKLDPKAVEEYSAIASTLVRAPLTIYEIVSGDFQGYKVLSSGHHRLEGATKAGLTEVPVIVRQGTVDDAYVEAVRSNRSHGVRFTSVESRRLIEQFIQQGKDNEFIMEVVLYSRAGVQNIRNEMRSIAEAGGKLPNLSNKHYRFLKDAPDSEQLASAASTHSWPVATLKEAIKILKNSNTTPLSKAAVLSTSTNFFALPSEPEVRDEEYHAQLAAAAAPPAVVPIVTIENLPSTHEVVVDASSNEDGPSDDDLNDPELAQLVAEVEAESASEEPVITQVEQPSSSQIDYSTSTTRNALSNTMGNLRRAMNEVFASGSLSNYTELSLKALLSDIQVIDDMIQEFGTRVSDEQRGRIAPPALPIPSTDPNLDALPF